VQISPITMVFVGDRSIVNGIINDYDPFITLVGTTLYRSNFDTSSEHEQNLQARPEKN
jgi:hypothetical protein